MISKKIIVLNGSPRAKGNTSALVDEFKKGAEEIGCEVTIFQLDKMNIHGCKGCFGGGKNFEHPCVQRDDMEKFIPFTVKLTWLFWRRRFIIGISAGNFARLLTDFLPLPNVTKITEIQKKNRSCLWRRKVTALMMP